MNAAPFGRGVEFVILLVRGELSSAAREASRLALCRSVIVRELSSRDRRSDFASQLVSVKEVRVARRLPRSSRQGGLGGAIDLAYPAAIEGGQPLGANQIIEARWKETVGYVGVGITRDRPQIRSGPLEAVGL